MNARLLLLLSLLGFYRTVFAVPAEATLYEKGSNFTKEIFRWKREEPGGGRIQLHFYGLDGKELVYEEAVADGFKVKSYELDHKQLGEKGSLKVEGKKIVLSYTKKGETDTETEDLPDNLVVGPTLVEYLKAHWAEILKGDTISVRYVAIDRKETVGFKFFKTEEKSWDGEEAIVVKMKPSSFVIAAIVDPLFFTFRKKDGRLLALVGRTQPKRRDGDDWKDVDAEIRYRYSEKG
jgi:hypothetical protein